jgi:hypothetical protein
MASDLGDVVSYDVSENLCVTLRGVHLASKTANKQVALVTGASSGMGKEGGNHEAGHPFQFAAGLESAAP